jgi:hypothetical protein
MAYTQLRDANWKVPYVGGWCLKYVQDAFGTDHPYASAIDAWNANYGGGNHPGELPPAGKTVAVYFTLGSVPAGHVAISLDDGSVASSTQAGSHSEGFIHPNLQNLIDTYAKYNGGCTYLGWSEYVGTVRVVSPIQAVSQPSQGGEDMIDQATLTQLFQVILGRAPDDGAVSHYVGHYSTSFVVNDLLVSVEHAQHSASIAQQTADLQGRITALTAQLATATKQASAEQAQIDGDKVTITGLQTKDATDGSTIADLRSKVTSDEASITSLTTQLKIAEAARDKALQDAKVTQVATAPPAPAPTAQGLAAFIKYITDLFKVKGAK